MIKTSLFHTARYWIALCLLLWTPGAFFYWFIIHPLAGFWRRIGYGWGFLAGFGVMIATAVMMAFMRTQLLAIEFGTNPAVILAGCAAIVIAFVIRRRRGKLLSFRTLMGFPELAPQKYPPKLLTEGIYGRIRHPRYAEVLVGLLGYALLSNYLAAYAAVLFAAAMISILIPIEERELRIRFGAEYDEYCRHVPALIPRLRT